VRRLMAASPPALPLDGLMEHRDAGGTAATSTCQATTSIPNPPSPSGSCAAARLMNHEEFYRKYIMGDAPAGTI